MLRQTETARSLSASWCSIQTGMGHFRSPAFSRALRTQRASPLSAATWTTLQFDEPNAEGSQHETVAVEASPCHWAIAKQECAESVEGKPTKMKQKIRASLKLPETGDANDREAV